MTEGRRSSEEHSGEPEPDQYIQNLEQYRRRLGDILPGVNAGASHTVGMPVSRRQRWQWVSTLEPL